MRLFIDSADRTVILRALATGYAAGVTTNPSLLRRAGLRRADLPTLVKAAADAGAPEIHLQVLSPTLDGMVTDGRGLHELDPDRVLVKVPATGDGFAAGARLTAAGVGITVTAVYAARQVVLAGAVGARYAAVYLGRMRDAGDDPWEVIGAMLDITRAQQMDVRLSSPASGLPRMWRSSPPWAPPARRCRRICSLPCRTWRPRWKRLACSRRTPSTCEGPAVYCHRGNSD